jgi:hypothetical protein
MTAENKPWLTSDPGLADDRVDAQSLLKRYQVLFRKLLVPGAVDASDNINKLLNGFTNAQLNALGSLFYLLERALFESPATVFGGEISGQRYLIEYVPPKQLHDFTYYIRTNLDDTSKVPFPGQDAVLAFFVEWTKTLRDLLDRSPAGMVSAGIDRAFIAETPSESTALKHWFAQLDEALSSFRKILDEDAARESAVQSAIEARQARDAARRAAGETGALSMGQHFKQIADAEAKSETIWNRTVFGLMAVILAGSAFIVYNSAYAQWVQTLLHLIIILPIVGYATYASRIAGHHRMVARWAKTASVQVNSVQAFAEQLNTPENRDKLILELGKNVFSTPTYGETSKIEHFSAIPPDWVDAVKEVAKKSVPGASKE